MIKSFFDLEVYKESFSLSLEIEKNIRTFPKDEKYLLIDQSRRASRAIPALIAEGYAKRASVKEFKKYLRDALGEANEMINHLALAKAYKYIEFSQVDDLINKYQILSPSQNKFPITMSPKIW